MAGDSVYFYNNAVSVTAGLNQSTVSLALLLSDSSYTGYWGTPTTFLQISSGNVMLGGVGASGVQGSGSGRLNLDTGTVASTVTVLSSAFSATDSGEPPIRLKGTNLVVVASSGSIGVGTEPGDVVTCTSIKTTTSTLGPPTIYCGPGSAVTNYVVNGGTVNNNSGNPSTTVTLNGGSWNKLGNSATTTLTINNGTVVYNGVGTVTQLNLYGGSIDLSQDSRTKTVTNCTTNGGIINNSSGSAVFTNGVVLSGIKLRDVSLDFGTGKTVSFS